MSTLTLNNLSVISARIVIPWRGVWIAEVDLEEVPTTMPSGKVTLGLGGVALQGFVDPLAVGSFTSKASLRVIGGASGGWDNAVPALQFHSDTSSLLSTLVYTQTASLVGETVSDPNPVNFGADFIRSAGPASRIFDGRDWYVDPASGMTNVSGWPAATLPADAVIVNFDPITGEAALTSDNLIFPNTTLSDSRFNGATYTIRDVEQVWSKNGSRVTATTSTNPVSRLTAVLYQMVQEFAASAFLTAYRYRFVLPVANDYSTMALQAITPGAPDLNPISQWTGLSGALSHISPGLEIVVGFTADNPPVPFIVTFSNLGTPSEISLAGGANFLVPAPWALAMIQALGTFASSLGSASNIGQVAAAGVALGTALATLPPYATILTKAT